jgi:hypothetical protein
VGAEGGSSIDKEVRGSVTNKEGRICNASHRHPLNAGQER